MQLTRLFVVGLEVFEDKFYEEEKYKAGWMTEILDGFLKIKEEIEEEEEKDAVTGELSNLNLHT